MNLDNEHFWLAASDIACKKKFVWCSGAEVVIGDYKWAVAQPSYSPGQDCMSQFFDGSFLKSSGFNDFECTKMARYYCK